MAPRLASTAVLLVLLIGVLICGSSAQTLEVEQATREINVATQVTIVGTKFTVKNVGKQAVDFIEFCHKAEHIINAAVFEITQGGDDGQSLQLGPSTTGNQIGIACFKAALQKPIQPGKSGKLRSAASFTNLQKPFPAAIFQNEPQRVLFTDNAYILSPYKIHKQTTSVKLPGKNVESYSIISPVSLSGSTLKYGEFSAKEPFSVEEMRLHFENNSPFAVVTKLVREVEISNWGNVYYEEHYTIKHKGPKIRGEWSRLDLMREPQTFGRTAVRGFLAHLPAGSHSIYFKDAIGNISTSQVRTSVQSTEVILTPRYPLYGGWQAEFILGYSLNLQDVVQKSRTTGHLTAVALFGSTLAGVVVDNLENRVVLPEGSALIKVNTPFLVEQGSDTKYTYLDTGGRPVVVVSKSNIVFEHNIGFTVEYSFSKLNLLREPLLLIAVFLLVFALVITYCRCNFVLTRGAAWEAEDKAERVAFLVEEITAYIAGREKEVLAASSGGPEEAAALLEKLKKSEAKLNARCKDLEGLAGPKHSAIVRDLLEKEKTVQSKIAQIASSRGQSAQGGGIRREGLQDISAGLKQEHATKLGQLN